LQNNGLKLSDVELSSMNLDEISEEGTMTYNPDMRERLLATTNAENNNYILVSCFTGAGTASVQFRNDYRMEEPDMRECEYLFPAGSEFAVDTLKKNVDKFNMEAGN